MLRLENVAMRYDKSREVLHDVNLSLAKGDFYFVMGPSGAGKTSLLRVLGLLSEPSRGRILMFDRDIKSLSRDERAALRRRIGIVFQDFRLLDHLSIYDNVALPLRIHGGEDAQIRDFVVEILAWIGLDATLEAKPSALSMGQRQLVAIARAVVTRPNLLLCDEPTSNIDSRLAKRLMHLFTQLCKLGTTVVISTHNDDLVIRYPHPVLHMAKGHLASPLPVTGIAAAS